MIRCKLIVIMLQIILVSGAISCTMERRATEETQEERARITATPYGQMPDGKPVTKYTMRNADGLEMDVINYGGIVTALRIPDGDGEIRDVALGFDSLSQYLNNNPYFGALIGRYGNRIAGGKFGIDGTVYNLPQNDGNNHLHGGPEGFDKVWWNIVVPDATKSLLTLTYSSADREQGYPGKLDVEVTYHLTDSNEWRITYRAVTDRKTVVNLTQHAYFNLSGAQGTDILSHSLAIDADRFLPVNNELIPTGELMPVEGTPFDFRNPTRIGARIDAENEQINFGKGYDHCWALNGYDGTTIRKVAMLHDSARALTMEVFTNEPGLQFYSGNFLDGTLQGKEGATYAFRTGLCLETQHYPDSPNQPDFPSVVLEPGKEYRSTTVYKFLIAGSDHQ